MELLAQQTHCLSPSGLARDNQLPTTTVSTGPHRCRLAGVKIGGNPAEGARPYYSDQNWSCWSFWSGLVPLVRLTLAGNGSLSGEELKTGDGVSVTGSTGHYVTYGTRSLAVRLPVVSRRILQLTWCLTQTPGTGLRHPSFKEGTFLKRKESRSGFEPRSVCLPA